MGVAHETGGHLGLASCQRRARRVGRGHARVRRHVPAADALRPRSGARRGRRPHRRLGAGRRTRACRRPAHAAPGRCPRRRRPPAPADLPRDRPLAGQQSRPARRLSRRPRPGGGTGPAPRPARTRRRARRSLRSGGRADRTSPRAARRSRGRARRLAADRLRAVFGDLRRRAQPRRPPLCHHGDCLPPGTARPRGPGRQERRRRAHRVPRAAARYEAVVDPAPRHAGHAAARRDDHDRPGVAVLTFTRTEG